MSNTTSKKLPIFLALSILAFFLAYVMTLRYFPVEPDSANSPLVWREFLINGFWAFKDWSPTPDSWYFTVYPVNFMFFLITGNDGIYPLALSSALYIALTALILTSIVHSITKSINALLVLAMLILLPAYVYIYGYAAHPFSHYSTNCFGVIVLGLCYYNLKKQSYYLIALATFIATLASVSDPWFQATFFLPLLIALVYFTKKRYYKAKLTYIYSFGFILSLSNLSLLQRLLNLPLQRFRLVSYDKWIENALQVADNLGSSLNLFYVGNAITINLSLLIWLLLFTYSFLICVKKGHQSLFIAIVCMLSVTGIISSFILSYNFPAGSTGSRFFVNAVVFIVTLSAIGLSFKNKKLLMLIFILYLTSSLYSYRDFKSSPISQEAITIEYIKFLNKHNLKFGYSDYWQMANSVNWLSQGKIHITPIMFDDDINQVNFSRARPQTMKSWLSDPVIKNSPNRQFFVLPLSETSKGIEAQAELLKQQIGEPDEVLKFKSMTVNVYNHVIEPKR